MLFRSLVPDLTIKSPPLLLAGASKPTVTYGADSLVAAVEKLLPIWSLRKLAYAVVVLALANVIVNEILVADNGAPERFFLVATADPLPVFVNRSAPLGTPQVQLPLAVIALN